MTTRLVRALPLALLALALAGPASAEVIEGTSGPDVLVGTPQADTIRGYGGPDKIYGKAGPDRLLAGRDNKRDLVYGARGHDRIHFRFGDKVYAGRGNDVLRLHLGSKWAMTHIYCGPGYDRLYLPGDGTGAAEPDNGGGWLWIYRSCEEVW